MKLSILILTIPYRFAQVGRLRVELNAQILPYAGEVEVVVIDGQGSIGEKRNNASQKATGDYVCSIDDDDWIAPNYIELLMKAVDMQPDCASLTGLYTVDGKADGVFEHSIKYKEWKTNPYEHKLDEGKSINAFFEWLIKNGWIDAVYNSSAKEPNVIYTPQDLYNIFISTIIKYERYPNHLNLIKASIAKQFKFPETNHGEDHDWSTHIHESGLLKVEYHIPEIIYFYNYVTKK